MPINISTTIPTPPPEHEIPGFGLEAKHQKFTPAQMPTKLQKLVRKSQTVDEIWDTLEKEQRDYKFEIRWIKQQWYYLLNGYWWYNNGTPMYMHGYHYAYCSFWELDIGLPEFRDRDRKFFLATEYAYTCTSTFAHVDHKGYPIKNAAGYYDFKDMGRRLFAGIIYPKHRREGATFKAECFNYFYTITKLKCHSGIQGMDENTGSDVFSDQLITPWKSPSMPFFFKPDYSGSDDPKARIMFTTPAKRRSGKQGQAANASMGLRSWIDFATTADRNFYDQNKLGFFHEDELGKTINENVDERHAVTVQCLLMGDKITGLTVKTSTVGEMNRRGGANFKKLADKSQWHKRNEFGETASKLMVVFTSAEEGLEGFVDEYGMSVVGTPTPEQAKYIGKSYGAREYLIGQEKQYQKEGDMEGYSNQCRLYPRLYKHCYMIDQKDSGFDMEIINNRIEVLENNLEITTRGNFVWATGRDSDDPRVEFEEHPNGRWVVSHLPTQNLRNLIYKDQGVWFPTFPDMYTHGADPYRFKKTEGDRISDGGGAAFREYDPRIDERGKDVSDWQTHRFVATYKNRAESKIEYADDMLKQTVFYGGGMYPESNIPIIEDMWEEWGYGGMLIYDIDQKTGRRNNRAGYYVGNNDKAKQLMFSEIKNYIKIHGRREHHKEFLYECRDIPGIEDLKDFDLLAACGGCLIRQRAASPDIKPEKSKLTDISDVIQLYRFH